jgi:2-C-methyl-D-erythritol 4-phosphate cytidylyltransferase
MADRLLYPIGLGSVDSGPFLMRAAIVVAAGNSQRMGFDKLTADLGGRPLFIRTLERFECCSEIDEIVLVTNQERTKHFANLVQEYQLKKVATVVEGGADRHLSVWKGLGALSAGVKLVAVHDGARPLVSSSTISNAVGLATKWGAVALAAPVVETLKKADSDGLVVGGIDRSGLWTMQTPQIFRRDWLVTAYEMVLARGIRVTDETSAAEMAGFPVRLMQSGDWNLKVTYPSDLELVRSLFSLETSKVGTAT